MKIRLNKWNRVNGGAEFVQFDTEEKTLKRGNGASTGWAFDCDILVQVNTLKELDRHAELLKSYGFEDLGRK